MEPSNAVDDGSARCRLFRAAVVGGLALFAAVGPGAMRPGAVGAK
jgi:hypothetical protein